MNRLIIIGNGFDLAHGFKTSYNDFIVHLFQEAVNTADYRKPYTNELFKVTLESRIPFDIAKDYVKYYQVYQLDSGKQNNIIGNYLFTERQPMCEEIASILKIKPKSSKENHLITCHFRVDGV